MLIDHFFGIFLAEIVTLTDISRVSRQIFKTRGVLGKGLDISKNPFGIFLMSRLSGFHIPKNPFRIFLIPRPSGFGMELVQFE